MTPPSSVATSEAELASRLRLAVTRLARRLRTQFPGQLSPSQLATLSTVERLGPLTLGELSAAERVKPPTMTKIVAGLEEQGLVSRTVDQSDRRVARVEATAAGLTFLEESRQQKDAYLAERLRSLDAGERAELERAAELLERLLEDG
jgi:DNA-binding MarR family transcriptional regulator